jgi:hypothetical protein
MRERLSWVVLLCALLVAFAAGWACSPAHRKAAGPLLLSGSRLVCVVLAQGDQQAELRCEAPTDTPAPLPSPAPSPPPSASQAPLLPSRLRLSEAGTSEVLP